MVGRRVLWLVVSAVVVERASSGCPQSLPSSAGLRLLVAVPSSPENGVKRSSIRSTWCVTAGQQFEATDGRAAVAVQFWVGASDSEGVEAALAAEATDEGDVARVPYSDTRYNVLRKTLDSLSAFATHAAAPTHYARFDDDSYVFADRVARGMLNTRNMEPDDEWVWSGATHGCFKISSTCF